MKGFPKIVVALNLKKMNDLTICSRAMGVKTTADPDVVNPPVSDATLKLQANAIMDIITLRKTKQAKSLTRQQKEEVEVLKRYYGRVGRYVQDIANDVAISAGDAEAGKAVVLRCGFTLKKKRVLPPRNFDVVKSAPGWTHIRVKAAGKYAVYIWRFGITSEKGVMPAEFMPIVVTTVCELIVKHPFSGNFMAYQVACVLPKPRSAHTKKAKSKLGRNASDVASYIGNKPVVEAGIDALQWSDFIYMVCK